MANYHTIVTGEKGIPCTPKEAEELDAELERAQIHEHHGFSFKREDGPEGLGYLEADENGTWSELPEKALKKIGELIARQEWPYLEFGAAFTCSRLIPGSHGGTAFRIYPDGTMVDRVEIWDRNLIEVGHTIANRLNGGEWNADTLDDIATILRNAGFTITEPNSEDK
jgi:hypothetical protein